MKKLLFWQWIVLGTVLALGITALRLKQRNSHLVKENNQLILVNDSVLSVNLELGKNLQQMQRTIDSIQMIPSVKQRLLTFH